MGASCARLDFLPTASEEFTTRPSFAPRLRCGVQDCSAGQGCSTWSVLSHQDVQEEAAAPSDADWEVGPSHQNFAILHGSPGRPVSSWRSRYALRRELGSGQTAVVFEAFATSPPSGDDSTGPTSPRPGDESWGGSSPSRTGRRVALKRFHKKRTVMFKTEQKALLAAGVHPHVIRLLESFEGGNEEDAIVLEHCEGGDIYELYASNKGFCMQEMYVAQIIRQLLQALQHLVERGIEHRDVKPENLLLYSGRDAGKSKKAPLIKLADFGWAAVVDRTSAPPAIPAEGVGSLWYAPPELNPPVQGAEIVSDELQGGKSDMWSTGVIAYLLLTGHSPFNKALTLKDPQRREAEVIRLAAFGDINTSTQTWNMDLSPAARDFILALIRPDPAKRLTPLAALHHAFIAISSSADLCGTFRLCGRPAMLEDASLRWNGLDIFQRLCWLAIARAVAEPELVTIDRIKDFVRQEGSRSGYIERLAAELVSAAVPSWFTSQAPWTDVLHLAFLYLDVDCDGLLSADDLSIHLPGGKHTREFAHACIVKWHTPKQVASPSQSVFLTHTEFRQAVASSATASWFPPLENRPPSSTGVCDVTWVQRMEAIEEVCRRFASEEMQ